MVKGLRLGGLKEALDLVAKGDADPEEFKVRRGGKSTSTSCCRGCDLAPLCVRPSTAVGLFSAGGVGNNEKNAVLEICSGLRRTHMRAPEEQVLYVELS